MHLLLCHTEKVLGLFGKLVWWNVIPSWVAYKKEFLSVCV